MFKNLILHCIASSRNLTNLYKINDFLKFFLNILCNVKHVTLTLCLHSLVIKFLPGAYTIFHACFVFYPPKKKKNVSQNVYRFLSANTFLTKCKNFMSNGELDM